MSSYFILYEASPLIDWTGNQEEEKQFHLQMVANQA